jgi:hypothetical protein
MPVVVLVHLVPQYNTSSIFDGMVLEQHANPGFYLLPRKSAVPAHLSWQCKIWKVAGGYGFVTCSDTMLESMLDALWRCPNGYYIEYNLCNSR